MKYKTKNLALALFAFPVLIYSFTIKGKTKDLNSLTAMVDQVNTDYKKISKPKPNKALSHSIYKALEASYTKTTTSAPSYGVFKAGSCEDYPELDVYMDCEDDNPWTKQEGWTGDSYVTADKNVHLKFCLVGGQYFERLRFDYAVLMVDYDFSSAYFKRVFDNQNNTWNSSNSNQTTKDGVNIYSLGYELIFGDDTELTFYWFPKAENTENTTFPYSGLNYGVLGRFGKQQGYIFTDDEDDEIIGHDSNRNSIERNNFDGNTLDLSQVIDLGENTTLFISKAELCEYP